MKKQTNESKWQTYRRLIFCLNAGPNKELNKSNSGYLTTFPTEMLLFSPGRPIPLPVFPRFFTTRQTAIRRSANFFTRRQGSKKFQHFRSQRQKQSLTGSCNVKGKISGGVKVFFVLIKANALWTMQNIAKDSFSVDHAYCLKSCL